MAGLLTPFPAGPMPVTVRRFDDLRIELATDDEWPGIVLDEYTGELFTVDRADCGHGCRCAAVARWVL